MNRVQKGALAVSLGAAALSCACTRKADVPFGDHGDHYATKVDFARLEQELPLTRGHLLELTPANLEKMTQEQVDQVYARLTAGPIPDGPYEGTFFFAQGGGLPRIGEQLGGLKGQAVGLKLQLLELVGQKIWKGKVFYRQERVLRNMIDKRATVDTFLADQHVDERQAALDRVRAGTRRTSSSPRGSTAGRACSTAGASRSSSTTRSRTRSPGTRRASTHLAAARARRSGTRSGWSAPASTWAGRTCRGCSR